MRAILCLGALALSLSSAQAAAPDVATAQSMMVANNLCDPQMFSAVELSLAIGAAAASLGVSTEEATFIVIAGAASNANTIEANGNAKRFCADMRRIVGTPS